ncbi:hypothetical protein M0802_015840 [Mischocyttarus mexicanus]|nr:hypothetical protein M0802_015840 [Mischocyttarus mexicanus]
MSSNCIETRADTVVTERLLRSTEMKTLRTITDETLFGHQCSDDIRRECNVQDSAMGLPKEKRLARSRCESGEQPISKDSTKTEAKYEQATEKTIKMTV